MHKITEQVQILKIEEGEQWDGGMKCFVPNPAVKKVSIASFAGKFRLNVSVGMLTASKLQVGDQGMLTFQIYGNTHTNQKGYPEFGYKVGEALSLTSSFAKASSNG